MESLKLNRHNRLLPLEIKTDGQVFSPKFYNHKKDLIINPFSATNQSSKHRPSEFRNNTKPNIQGVGIGDLKNQYSREKSELKTRDRNKMFKFLQTPLNSDKRIFRSRLRHPKIAVTRKNMDKIRAFSIQSDFEDCEHLLSFEDSQDSSHLDDPFKANSYFESNRIDTPGFMKGDSKQNT